MTETCKTAGTDYVPISCALHSEYELAILRRQRLRLVWNDSSVIRDQVVQPLDLKTMNNEEFLTCRTEDDVTQNIRLDRVLRVYPA
jgi:Rho-binding antiterminator